MPPALEAGVWQGDGKVVQERSGRLDTIRQCRKQEILRRYLVVFPSVWGDRENIVADLKRLATREGGTLNTAFHPRRTPGPREQYAWLQ